MRGIEISPGDIQQARHGRPLWLGSVKSNIGHAQAVNGPASMVISGDAVAVQEVAGAFGPGGGCGVWRTFHSARMDPVLEQLGEAVVEGGDLHALSHALALDGRQPLSEVLPLLAAWRRQERDRSVTAARLCGVLAGRRDRGLCRGL